MNFASIKNAFAGVSMKRGFGLGSGLAVIIGVIALVICDNVIKAQTFNSTLSNTIAGYIVPIAALGVLALAAGYRMGGD